MKRVKIMLMSICLVALAGGVLAFKARIPSRVCTATTVNNACPNVCPNLVQVIPGAAGGNIICTASPIGLPNNQFTCTFLQNGSTATVACEGTVRRTSAEE